MAEKRSIESMLAEAKQLDERIKQVNERLHKLQKQRTDLDKRIERARAFEILGILQERNISIEDAAEILSAANPVIPVKDGDNE